MLRTPLLAAVMLAATSAAQTPGGIPALPPESRLQRAEVIRTSVGWRDNVMLSPFSPLGRAFLRGEAESFLALNRRDWRLISLLSGDVLRYFAPPAESAGEQQWFAHLEARWQRWAAWRVSLKADGFLQDVVSDLSETEAVRTVLATRVRGAFATIGTRVELPAALSLEPFFQVKRVDYALIPGDYDESRGGFRLEWRAAPRLLFSLVGVSQDRSYATRQQHTAGGRPLAGTQLRFGQDDAVLRAETGWTLGGEWKAALAAGEGRNRDGASGFFDFDQRHGRLELGWRPGSWRLALDAEARRTDYLVQTVGAGIAPPPRISDGFMSRLRLERTLPGGWGAFGEFAWERARSNEREFSYRSHGVSGGVQREF